MSNETRKLPGFWRFVWLFFMQPITLHEFLTSLSIDPNEPGWKLARRRLSLEERWWLARSAQTIALALCAVLLSGGLLEAFGMSINWPQLAIRVIISSAIGITLGMFLGLPSGLSSGAAAGISAGVMEGLSGVIGGMVMGIALSSPLRVASGVNSRPSFGATFAAVAGLAFGLVVGLGISLERGSALGAAKGTAVAVFFFLGYLRIPTYLIEVLFQTVIRFHSVLTGRTHLRLAPVLYHNLSFFPHPFLKQQILDSAENDPELVSHVLRACTIAPGQRQIGLEALAALQADDMSRLAKAGNLRAIQELTGKWLPGVQGADGLLLSFSESARYLAAAQAAFGAHHKLNHLKGFARQIIGIERQLRTERNRKTTPFESTLVALRNVGNQMRIEAEKDAAGLLPNPFSPGDALTTESGRELFRGRDSAIHDIENALSDASRSLSLQLLAPRRSGKTSLLKMLPDMVPDAICVFFDLQANPASSLASFWNQLAERAIVQAKTQRLIDLPPFPDGPPMEAANVWLGLLDQLPNNRRVLIAIDEFERLESLFPFSKQELLQLMGLLRATIQHRRNVRILVSGAAPFDELDRIWDDHFINTRQIKLPFLERTTSIELLMQPSADFPSGAIPQDVALEVFRRTGGQPFLLQIFGSLLVDHLNSEKRQVASLADVDAIQTRAIDWAEPYFRDMHKDAPSETRESLALLAHGETVPLTPRTRRWLAQRYLLTPEDTLAIPLFASWIDHFAPV